jgi:crotonobetainyl-CoA:carnitine CoA-transferase CaiB-like acyl-CoA transferase
MPKATTRRRSLKPLDGVRVIDLTRILAGPFGTMMLGDMGADVIKVEEPGKGDDTRQWPPFVGGEATYFMSVNRNKRGVTLNLKTEKGRALFAELVRKSDVVIENFRPGTMEALGLGYTTLAALNKRLIYCAISGFGESGPEAHRAGYDLIVQAESGIMDLTGFPDGPPAKVGVAIGDLVAGLMATQGILLALVARRRTRRGQKIEIGMLDGLAALLTFQAGIYFGTGKPPRRRGNAHPSIVPYEVFGTADGYVAVGVANNSLWQRCCAVLERPDLLADSRFSTEAKRVENRDTIIPLLSELFKKNTSDDWVQRLTASGIPAGRIRRLDEVCRSEHLRTREMVVTLPHPTAGSVTMMGVPVKLSATPGEAVLAPPLLGQHTEEVLRELLLLPDDEILHLRHGGVV